MLQPKIFHGDDPENLKAKALEWANSFDTACYFDSNNYPDLYSAFDVLIAAGVDSDVITGPGHHSFEQLQQFLNQHKAYIPGYLSYDLKNETENLESNNPDHLHFPNLYFFVPEHLILIKGIEINIYSKNAEHIWKSINTIKILPHSAKIFDGRIHSRFSRDEYVHTVHQLQEHIRRGDIYEMNLCQEFFAENAFFDPVKAFIELNKISPTPFSGFFKNNNQYIISASPERFLSRRGNKLISQPIKGTSARNTDPVQDEHQKAQLKNNEKELSENVMIVDLVRNDLTKSAKPGSVYAEELFGVYSFKQVHQLISTVVCEAADGITNAQTIQNTFPMGSMTGAPKIRAMQLAEKYERSRRGIYSGALGYFSPEGDFDFNVVIRTLLYNADSKYLSFQVGSAITYDSDAEQEYEECILKAQAINEVLAHKKTR
jgi:para-aminobenzoate synthetase component I